MNPYFPWSRRNLRTPLPIRLIFFFFRYFRDGQDKCPMLFLINLLSWMVRLREPDFRNLVWSGFDGSSTAFRSIGLLTFCRCDFWTLSFSWLSTKTESLVHIPFSSIFKKHLQVLWVLHTHLKILFANYFCRRNFTPSTIIEYWFAFLTNNSFVWNTSRIERHKNTWTRFNRRRGTDQWSK